VWKAGYLHEQMLLQARQAAQACDLRHAKADTTANEYMQELPESVKQMVGSVYAMLSMQPEPRKDPVLLLPNATKSFGEDAVSC